MRYWLLGLVFIAFSACQPAPKSSPPDSFSFIVIGDTPYDDKDREMLAAAVPLIKAGDYPFILHVGDYKRGAPPCTAADDQAQLDLIESLAPTPVFYTPGDNEWTDCDRLPEGAPDGTEPSVSELERLGTVRRLFFSSNSPAAHGAVHQEGQPENARWSYADVQFATLHIVATNNGRSQVLFPQDRLRASALTAARDAANLEWLKETFEEARTAKSKSVVLAMQADMTDLYVDKKKPERSQVPDLSCGDDISEAYLTCDAFTELRAAIRGAALGFDGPVILIHGDSSPFTLNQSFSGEEAPNLWRLNAAGDAGSAGRTNGAPGT